VPPCDQLLAEGLTWSAQVAVAVSIIAFGTAIASWGELAFSLLGFLIMVTSEFCEAVKLAAMQYFLGNLKLQLMEGIYYFTPAGFIWMAAFILPLELERMRRENAWQIVSANPAAFMGAATLGFFVNLLSFGVIQSTSSLTFKVLGQLKNVAVVLSSVVLFASVVSPLQALGYTISIAGFYLYNKAKSGPALPASGKEEGLGEERMDERMAALAATSSTNLALLGEGRDDSSTSRARPSHSRQPSFGDLEKAVER